MAMGEAAAAAPCLFASHEFKEGNPLRALTTSVSFGRFVNEPLNWEKWSSFSHNRIREDVQKHSRPGVVAERKAFFEAYFNKSKKSSKSYNKENISPHYPPQTNASLVDKGAKREISSNEDFRSPLTNLVLLETGNVDENLSSSKGAKREISSNEDVRSPLTNLVLPQTGNVDKNVSSNKGAKREISLNEEVRSPLTNLVLPKIVNVDENVSSNKGAKREIASKKEFSLCATNLVFAEVGNIDDIISSIDDVISNIGQVEQEKTLTGNVTLENHCLEVKVSKGSSHVDENKKRKIKDKISAQTKTDIFSVKSSSRKAVIPEVYHKNQILKCNPRVPSVNVVANYTRELPKSENKRSKPLVDYSVNANKTVVLKKNTQPLSISENKRPKPVVDRLVNANKPDVLKKNTQPFSISENKRSKPLVDLKKNTQALPRTEIKWSKPLLDRLVNGNKTVILKSRSTNHTEALTASTKKPRSVTVPSSFTFKSDERAAKRKQFSQKLEEKPKLKEEAKGDHKKLRWSTALEAKTRTSETKGPSNKLQKVEPTRTRPQKLGMKPKNFIEINKKSLSSSMACLPSKKLH